MSICQYTVVSFMPYIHACAYTFIFIHIQNYYVGLLNKFSLRLKAKALGWQYLEETDVFHPVRKGCVCFVTGSWQPGFPQLSILPRSFSLLSLSKREPENLAQLIKKKWGCFTEILEYNSGWNPSSNYWHSSETPDRCSQMHRILFTWWETGFINHPGSLSSSAYSGPFLP